MIHQKFKMHIHIQRKWHCYRERDTRTTQSNANILGSMSVYFPRREDSEKEALQWREGRVDGSRKEKGRKFE